MVTVDGLSDHYDQNRFPVDFDFVVPFNEKHLGWMRQFGIPEEYRIRESSDKVQILEFDADYRQQINETMTELSEISNCHPWQDDISRFRYQQRWMTIAKLQADSFLSQVDMSKVRLLAPLRAGALATVPYQLPPNQIGAAVYKRLPKANGETWVGLKDVHLPALDANSIVVVTEGCTGSGATVVATMLYFLAMAIPCRHLELHTINSPQHSMLFMLSAAAELGFELTIRSATISYFEDAKLYNHWGKPEWLDFAYVLSDVGDFSVPLPPAFNARAWWNIGRQGI